MISTASVTKYKHHSTTILVYIIRNEMCCYSMVFKLNYTVPVTENDIPIQNISSVRYSKHICNAK